MRFLVCDCTLYYCTAQPPPHRCCTGLSREHQGVRTSCCLHASPKASPKREEDKRRADAVGNALRRRARRRRRGDRGREG
eukprot:3777187-Rhodomonas_salina.2